MEIELPKRKSPHLKDYDYSSEGAYFVTICVQDRKKLLSRVVGGGLFDVICAYKSLTTRECKKIYPIDKLFQASFMEHIIRNQEDYNDRARYIEENSLRWLMKKHSTENNKNL